jgi:hypothetical protein
MVEPIFMKPGMCIMAPDPNSTRKRLGKIPPIFGKQRLGKNFTVATNKHATIEEL